MSIEQEINRNTMTIAELVKAVRELTEAIKGAGTAAAKATTAVTDFARMAATASVTIDTVQVGEVSSTKTTITPVADETPIEQGPFFWSHPESGSYGMVKTLAELNAMLEADGCCQAVSAEQYIQIVEAENEAAAQKAKPADENPCLSLTAPDSGLSQGEKARIEQYDARVRTAAPQQVVRKYDASPADQNRYFHDTVHRAAYKIAPTESLNGLQARSGVEEINAEQYAVLKAEYTKLTDQVIAGNAKAAPAVPTAAPVATPPSAPAAAAPSPTVTSSEPPPSAPEPAASPAEPAPPVAEPTWPEVHATLMRLVKTAGCGAPQLIALLEDFGVKRPETALALQTKAVGRFAEIIANAELRMKGGAA